MKQILKVIGSDCIRKVVLDKVFKAIGPGCSRNKRSVFWQGGLFFFMEWMHTIRESECLQIGDFARNFLLFPMNRILKVQTGCNQECEICD